MAHVLNGQTVLVTGHTGFKGSWLTLLLLHYGAKVVGISLPGEENSLFNACNLVDSIDHYECDIRDFNEVSTIVKQHQPRFVFHLAAQPLVSLSYSNPIETYQTNVMGTLHVFESIRRHLNECYIINVTSDKCYENDGHGNQFVEDDRFGGNDIYSSSKACSEILTQSFRNSFLDSNNIHLASARAGNVIGGGDWSENRIIPDCIRALWANQSIKLKNPTYVRPWQHVIEPVYGYVLLALKLKQSPKLFSEGWNFGPHLDSCITVEALTKKVIEYWGKGTYQVATEASFKESSLLRLSIDKAINKLNWKPAWNIDQTVKETVAWYQVFVNDQSSIYDKTIQQMTQYLDSIDANV